MRVVPLAAVPSQTLAIVLDGQNAQIALRQNGPSMYFSLAQDDKPVVTTRICRDRQLLLVDARYRGFRGDFLFIDQQGDTDPTFTGLGARYQLVYVTQAEITP